MRKGLAIFLGLILILISAVKLLPFFGITISIVGFSLDQWFPVVFIFIGICELLINLSVNWFWALAMIVVGIILLFKNMGWIGAFIGAIDIETMLVPALIFIYGIKVLFSSK